MHWACPAPPFTLDLTSQLNVHAHSTKGIPTPTCGLLTVTHLRHQLDVHPTVGSSPKLGVIAGNRLTACCPLDGKAIVGDVAHALHPVARGRGARMTVAGSAPCYP